MRVLLCACAFASVRFRDTSAATYTNKTQERNNPHERNNTHETNATAHANATTHTNAGTYKRSNAGTMSAVEECDDGNTSGGDGCSETCGTENGWACEYTELGSGCTTSCGDGLIAGDETCDDGNMVTETCAYGEIECLVCDATCQSVAGKTSYCGDGEVGDGEECDDGANNSNNAACLENCQFASCGDNFVCSDSTSCGLEEDTDGLEECDDGGESAICNTNCESHECGDGVLNLTAGELCDDGNKENGDGCAADCTFLSWQNKLPEQNQTAQTVARTSAISGWNDMLFTISEQGNVFAIDDRSGDIRWTHATGDTSGFRHTLMRGNWSEAQPQSGEDQFYSVSDGGYIHCIDPYGRCSENLGLACVHDSDCSSAGAGTCVTTGYCLDDKSIRCINNGDCNAVGGQCTAGNRSCCNTDRCGADCDVHWQSSYPHVGVQPNACYLVENPPFYAPQGMGMGALASDACQAGQPCTNPSMVAMDGQGHTFQFNYCGSQAVYFPDQPMVCVPHCYTSTCTWPFLLTYFHTGADPNNELDFYCPNCVPTLGSRTLSDPWEFFLTPYN